MDSCHGRAKRQRRVESDSKGIKVKGETDSHSENEETPHFHFYTESKVQIFDETRVTFTLQDMAEESTSQSVTLVSIVNSDSRSVGSDTQFQSTAEGSGSAYGSENDNSDSSSRTMQSLGLPEREQEEDDLRSESGLIMAGPTNPLDPRRTKGVKVVKFTEEHLQLKCEWIGCEYITRFLHEFMAHVAEHTPAVVISNEPKRTVKVFLVCKWEACPFETRLSEDLQRHLYVHAYHTKLKSLGSNAIARFGSAVCRADGEDRNIVPDLSENLTCAWDKCSERFINIQLYYDHINYHCQDHPSGTKVSGGIRCLWTGCANTFNNKTKLRDHVRSHTQEKVLACPTCGGLFSNRTRLFDHCKRQDAEHMYACEYCRKTFSTSRLLRDHIRSHVNNYRCPECDMTCTSPSALASHVKFRHSEEKPFRCPTCFFACKSQSDLTRHYKTHDDQLKIFCEEEDCDYTTRSITSLNQHYAMNHSGCNTPKYVCHMCSKRYYRGNTLTRHLVAIHKLQWPSGHSRFRYKKGNDGLWRLLTLRYETEEFRPNIPEAEREAGMLEQAKAKKDLLSFQNYPGDGFHEATALDGPKGVTAGQSD